MSYSRCLIAAVISAIAAAPASGQSIQNGSPVGIEYREQRDSTNPGKPPLPSGFIWSQTRAGLGSGGKFAAIGLLAGAVAGKATMKGPVGLEALGPPLAGAFIGFVVGGAIGVHRYSASQGVHAPFAASMAGAVVGGVGIVAGGLPVLFTVPFGAAVGHNMARRADPAAVVKP